MGVVTDVYVVSSVVLVVASLTLVGLGVKAYAETFRRSMFHLALGFGLVGAATAATVLSALMNDFEPVRSLLVVHNGINVAGFSFIIYSLVSYE